jgi:hypothetical protein
LWCELGWLEGKNHRRPPFSPMHSASQPKLLWEECPLHKASVEIW